MTVGVRPRARFFLAILLLNEFPDVKLSKCMFETMCNVGQHGSNLFEVKELLLLIYVIYFYVFYVFLFIYLLCIYFLLILLLLFC